MTPDPITKIAPVKQIAVLVSGRGSNLQALIDASAAGQLGSVSIALVLSNVEGAFALERASRANIPTCVISHRGWATRDDFDRAIVTELQRRDVDLVCLAGFMRKLGRPLLHAYPDAILNIHPSLLPAFPGLHPQRQALAHGVKVSGVTVHLVTDDLDDGPIVVQRVVPVLDGDGEETLAARILHEEHLAYPEAVRLVLSGGRVEGRRWISAQPQARGGGEPR
jgi:phosphoribosylglycinamide formyltransferase 1